MGREEPLIPKVPGSSKSSLSFLETFPVHLKLEQWERKAGSESKMTGTQRAGALSVTPVCPCVH